MRGSACSRYREQGRSSVPPRRPIREAPQTDGGVGDLLHHAKGEQDRGVSTLVLPRTIALMKNPWNQFSLDAQLARKVTQRIDPLLTDPAGVPNGKSKRRQLSR